MKKYVEIENIHAREVLDSKGYPTIEVEVKTEEGDIGRAIVPSDFSNEKYSVLEKRDGDKKRYSGMGVLNEANNINSLIAQEIEGLNVLNQKEIDEALIDLDGTENKGKLGANTILGVSIAVCKASACNLQIPLYQHLGGISGVNIPTPIISLLSGKNIINNILNIKEISIVPTSIKKFSERIRMCIEVYWNLNKDVSNIKNEDEAISIVLEQIKKCGYDNDIKIALSFDIKENNNSKEAINNYEKLIKKYPIIIIEDGISQDDWEGWQDLTKALGDKVQILGARLFETNINRLVRGIDKKVANGVLVRPNQIGTVTETIDFIRMAKSHGYSISISGSNADTEDAFISDLAVGLNARYIKVGPPIGSENISKYNRLLRIEEMI